MTPSPTGTCTDARGNPNERLRTRNELAELVRTKSKENNRTGQLRATESERTGRPSKTESRILHGAHSPQRHHANEPRNTSKTRKMRSSLRACGTKARMEAKDAPLEASQDSMVLRYHTDGCTPLGNSFSSIFHLEEPPLGTKHSHIGIVLVPIHGSWLQYKLDADWNNWDH